MEKKTVMIVDDTDAIRESVDILLEEKYVVIKASGVEDMYTKLEENIPDLILLDIMMPDGNGMVAKTRIKGDRRYAKIPVVFLTAVVDEKVKNIARIQSEAYLNKPFTEKQLLETVEKILEV